MVKKKTNSFVQPARIVIQEKSMEDIEKGYQDSIRKIRKEDRESFI